MAEKKAASKKAAGKKTATAAKQAEEKKAYEIFKGRVVYGNLNIRREPKVADGNITGVLKNGTTVEILGEKGDWFQIEDGWIMAKYIEREDA